MQIQNSLSVPLPPTEAWRVLMDIPCIIPCTPGAELIERVDGRTYRAGQHATAERGADFRFSLIVRALWAAIRRLFTRKGPDGPKAR
jgi:hypothetical protein